MRRLPVMEVILRLVEEGAGLHVLDEIRAKDVLPLAPLRLGVLHAAEHAGLARQLLEVAARAVVPAHHLDRPGQLLERGGQPLFPGVHPLGERLQDQPVPVAVHEQPRKTVRLGVHQAHRLAAHRCTPGDGRLQPGPEPHRVHRLLRGRLAGEEAQRERAPLCPERLTGRLIPRVDHRHHPSPGCRGRLEHVLPPHPRAEVTERACGIRRHPDRGRRTALRAAHSSPRAASSRSSSPRRWPISWSSVTRICSTSSSREVTARARFFR